MYPSSPSTNLRGREGASFRRLFLEHFRTMVRSGLAWSRVQPFLEINQLRATSLELRANANFGLLGTRGSRLEALY